MTFAKLVGAALLIATVAAVTPVAASREEGSKHESHDGSAEAVHAGHEPHRNHLSVFVGGTEAEDNNTGEKEKPEFTLGIDYERRVNRLFGAGGLADWVAAGEREVLFGVPVFIHAGRRAKFLVAPCIQFEREHGHSEFVGRIGFAYDFEVRRLTIAPALNVDCAESHEFLVLGVNVGWGF